jgi:hypothetical protein
LNSLLNLFLNFFPSHPTSKTNSFFSNNPINHHLADFVLLLSYSIKSMNFINSILKYSHPNLKPIFLAPYTLKKRQYFIFRVAISKLVTKVSFSFSIKLFSVILHLSLKASPISQLHHYNLLLKSP